MKNARQIRVIILLLENLAYSVFDKVSGEERKVFNDLTNSLRNIANSIESEGYND